MISGWVKDVRDEIRCFFYCIVKSYPYILLHYAVLIAFTP